jgi:hypothetical protein
MLFFGADASAADFQMCTVAARVDLVRHAKMRGRESTDGRATKHKKKYNSMACVDFSFYQSAGRMQQRLQRWE